jgi:hypothetical protein
MACIIGVRYWTNITRHNDDRQSVNLSETL